MSGNQSKKNRFSLLTLIVVVSAVSIISVLGTIFILKSFSGSNVAKQVQYDLQGQAVVIDGDDIEISGINVRLSGIDAIEIKYKQKCCKDGKA